MAKREMTVTFCTYIIWYLSWYMGLLTNSDCQFKYDMSGVLQYIQISQEKAGQKHYWNNWWTDFLFILRRLCWSQSGLNQVLKKIWNTIYGDELYLQERLWFSKLCSDEAILISFRPYFLNDTILMYPK